MLWAVKTAVKNQDEFPRTIHVAVLEVSKIYIEEKCILLRAKLNILGRQLYI